MNTLVKDTARVTYRRKRDKKTIYNAVAQLASIAIAADVEKIKGDVGNRTIATLYSNKEITLTNRNATFNLDFLAITQGVDIEEKTITVTHREDKLEVKDNNGVMTVTITKDPIGDSVDLIDGLGNVIQATVSTKTVTVPVGFAEPGDKISAAYRTDVTGNVLELDAATFAEEYEVEYWTVEYDPKTQQILNDLYIIFDSVQPAADVDISFENGAAITPEFTFNVNSDGESTAIGRFVQVPRNKEGVTP